MTISALRRASFSCRVPGATAGFLRRRDPVWSWGRVLGRQSLENDGIALAAPSRQQGRVQAFTTEKGSHAAGTFGAVGLGQNALIVFRGEAATLGLSDDLGIGAGLRGGVGFAVGGTPVAFATLGLPPFVPTAKPLGKERGPYDCSSCSRRESFSALHCN